MDWELVGKIVLALLAILGGGFALTIKTKNKKNKQVICKNQQIINGDNNIQAGGNVTTIRGNNNENRSND